MIDIDSFTKASNYKGTKRFETFASLYSYLCSDFAAFLGYACKQYGFQISKMQIARANALQAGHNTVLLTTFRGSSKSFDIDCYIIWRWMRVPNTKILLLSAKDDNAFKHVRRIVNILKRLPVTQWVKLNNVCAKGFQLSHASVEETMSFQAAGIFSSIEGSRADLVIPDDCEVKRNSETPALRLKLLQRLSEVQAILHPLEPYRHGKQVLPPEQTQGVFIGTPQTEFSIYNVEEEEETHPLKDALRFCVPALVNNLSTFPERFSTQQMILKRRKMSSPEWYLQMMLNPKLLDKQKAVIDVDKLVKVNNAQITDIVVTVDPIGDEGNGKDEAAICVAGLLATKHGYMAKNMIVVKHLSGHKLKADDFAAMVIATARKYRASRIIVESNFNIWSSYLKRSVEEAGGFASVEKINSSSKKHPRLIETLEAPLNAGLVLFEQEVLADKTNIEQMKMFTFNPKSLSNDDRLDALSFAVAHFAQNDRMSHSHAYVPDEHPAIIGGNDEQY